MSTVIRKKRFVLGRRHNGMLMAPQEFDAITDYDERYSYELINGVLVVNPIPSHFERSPIDELGHWLKNYQEHQVRMLHNAATKTNPWKPYADNIDALLAAATIGARWMEREEGRNHVGDDDVIC